MPRKRTGATLSPHGEAGAPNGFVQEKRQERGRAAAGSREGMDRAPGRAAGPGGPARAGRRLSALLSGPGSHRKGRAPRGRILCPACSEKSPPAPLQKAGLSLTVCSQELTRAQPARNIPALILWRLILSRVSGQLNGFHPNTRLLRGLPRVSAEAWETPGAAFQDRLGGTMGWTSRAQHVYAVI